MKKIVDEIRLNYIYNAKKRNAHYSFDGIKYMNGGEFAECLDKYIRGFAPVKDANTPFDVDSDIPELGISVKSQNCGLTDRRLADNFDDYVKLFFKYVHSKYFDWVVINDNIVTIYAMNKKEFKTFVKKFCRWDSYSMKPKFGLNTLGMIAWLELHCA